MKMGIPRKVCFAAGLSLLMVGVFYHLLSQIVHAQFQTTSNSVRALVLSKTGDLFAGTFGNGIFFSSDQGAHWEKRSEGLKDRFILTLVDGSGSDIFAGTVRKGVFRTSDLGLRWEVVDSGLGKVEVPVLFSNGKVLYAGTGKGVFRTTNRGKNWEAYNTGMEKILVRSLLKDARGVLFAGTAGRGLYQRGSGSAVWKQVTRGFGSETRAILENFIRTLSLGPDGTMYAGTFDGGVYISQNGGKRWDTWSEGLRNHSVRALIVGRNGTIFLGTGKGVYVREPMDTQWSFISPGLEDDSIQSMVVSDRGEVYVGTTLGLYKGGIDGRWKAITLDSSEI